MLNNIFTVYNGHAIRPYFHFLKACLTSIFIVSGSCIHFVLYGILTCRYLSNGFRVLSRGDLRWPPLACDVSMPLSKSSDIV